MNLLKIKRRRDHKYRFADGAGRINGKPVYAAKPNKIWAFTAEALLPAS